MNKLSLDEIGFIKKRIQQFIGLPASPKWQQNDSKDMTSSKANHKKKHNLSNSKSNKKVIIKESPKKIINGKKQTKNGNNDWIKNKEKQIENFINQQNRNKLSVLNKFLHSDQIHLKKRQELEPDPKNPNDLNSPNNPNDLNDPNKAHNLQLKEENASKNFSFDHQLSDQNKVYTNIDSFLGRNQIQEKGQKQIYREKQNEKSRHNQNNFSLLLKHMESDSSMLEKVQQKPQPPTNISPFDMLVRPSAMKGKHFINPINQPQTPKLIDVQGHPQNANPNPYHQKVNQKNRLGILKRSNSNSSLSLQKSNKSPYQNYFKRRQNYNKNPTSSRPRNNVNPLSKDQSHKSLQRFFDGDASSIREVSSKKGTSQQRHNKNFYQFNESNSKLFLSTSRKQFPVSVYRKTFKDNPYGLSSEQKFFINKYKVKQLSPDQRKELKHKYELLDKRLEKILDDVKKEKEVMTPCFTVGNQLMVGDQVQKRGVIAQQIITYNKLSPLRKFLQINKGLRDQGQMQV